MVRTSLLPGMLKTVRENKSLPLPLKVFEVSDVAIQDPKAERQVTNYRRLSAVYMDKKAGFQMVHGLLDRIMQILGVPFLQTASSDADYGYYIAGAQGKFTLDPANDRSYISSRPRGKGLPTAQTLNHRPGKANPLASTFSAGDNHILTQVCPAIQLARHRYRIARNPSPLRLGQV